MFLPSLSHRVFLSVSGAGVGMAVGLTLLANSQAQDTKASDSYENAMTVMQVNPLLKTAMRQMKGIRLEATDEEMVLTLLSRFSWFKLQERYPWSGQAVQVTRRDFRRGKARGNLTQELDALWIEQSWTHPVAGHGSECAWSPEPGTLYVDSTIEVGGKVAQYRQVYHAQA